MTTHLSLGFVAAAALMAAVAGCGPSSTRDAGVEGGGQSGRDMSAMPGMSAAGSESADGAMAHEHMGMGPHMKMTAARPRAAGDDRRAEAIVETLRGAIARYRDYRVAVADHFIQFLPNIRQPMYHFSNWRYGLEAQFHFDPSRPTSLLYRPTASGFELVGAMYTAPRRFDESRLDERVPLSVAAWHQHVNLCLPAPFQYQKADWTRFGLRGTITTPAECQAVGGVFHPVVLGWMVHVFPFEKDPAKVWAQ